MAPAVPEGKALSVTVVTGASGHAGANLVRALLDGGTETRAGVARLLEVDAKTLWRALAADEY